MTKQKFTVLFLMGSPQIIYAEYYRQRGDCGATFYNGGYKSGEEPAVVADFPKVDGVVVDAGYVSQPEPIRELGAMSVFSSQASPLVEAIESTARVVVDLELQDDQRGGPAHLTTLGAMSRHLEVLLGEQRAQLCVPPGMMR